MSRVLITRPLEDAGALALAVGGRGHEVLIEPLLEIALLDQPLPDLKEIQAILFTSANGVRAFAPRCSGRELPVYAVGRATAAAAIDHGFWNVSSADGDVAALARLVIGQCRPEVGAMLQIAATERAGDLGGLLTAAGFVVRRAVLYQARPAAALSAATVAALSAGAVDAVLLFSPRTARALAALLSAAGLATAAAGLTLVCLSGAVAGAASESGLSWRAVRVAARPDQDALLAALGG
ncbi:MAG: uroporphyrinogen-III synthase [Rhodospirillaceae bacterium]